MSDAKESIQRLQMMEQNAQTIAVQRQQFQAQLFEVEGALKELENAPAAFKIVGGIMIGASKDDVKTDLAGKKELLEVRVQSLEKQEVQIQEKLKQLQKQVLDAQKE